MTIKDIHGHALSGAEMGAVEHRGRSGRQHQGAVDPPRDPERDDEPGLALVQGEVVRALSLQDLAERCPGHRHRGEVGDRTPLSRVEQRH